MQNCDKIQRILIVLIVLNIMVLLLVVQASNFTYAQENLELHKKTLYEITKDIPSKQNAHITVGQTPTGIGINFLTNRIYVANSGDNTVSVIDDKNNTKIGNDIPVGKSFRNRC